VFPTVTRVNSASVATGAYPAGHGLMGNTVYFREVDPARGLSTAEAKNLFRISAATDGALLTATTLGEVLEANGERLLAVSSGSQGSAMLLNHTVSGGAVINTALVLPESLEARVAEALGPVPEDGAPNAGRNRWAVDAYLAFGLDALTPRVTIMWLSDPDHTAHEGGIGAPVTKESLRLVDAEVGRILAVHAERGIQANVIIMSDHGFSTHTGGANPTGPLTRAGIKEGPRSDEVVVVDGAVYVNRGGDDVIAQIVRLYQQDPAIGAVFTRAKAPGSPEGFVPGTLSLGLVHWDHARAGDVLVDAQWTDDENEYGYKGTTTLFGTAGHGTSSPWDLHGTLIAAGPDFKESLRASVPTGNVDIAPTICHLLGVAPPASMQGRVMHEILRRGPDPATVPVEKRVYTASAEWDTGSYTVTLDASIVNGHRYVDSTHVERTGGPASTQ